MPLPSRTLPSPPSRLLHIRPKFVGCSRKRGEAGGRATTIPRNTTPTREENVQNGQLQSRGKEQQGKTLGLIYSEESITKVKSMVLWSILIISVHLRSEK